MAGNCPLCLKDLKEPICIPCGHVYCSGCIGSWATGKDTLTFKARCPLPSCRQDFNLFIPDINAVPKKFRSFLSQPMRRVHLSISTTEEELIKERDQYKHLSENLRIANTSIDERAKSAIQEAEYYKSQVEELRWKHEEERKNLEARIQVLEGRLTLAECRNQRVLEAAVEDSPRILKRRRTEAYRDENTLVAPGSPMASTPKPQHRQQSSLSKTPMEWPKTATSSGFEEPPVTPNNPWMTPRQPGTPNSSNQSFRFAFRAPSASLLALRGPQKKRDYSRTAPKF